MAPALPVHPPDEELRVPRPITFADSSAVVDIAVDSGLFSAAESGIVERMVADYVDHLLDDGHVCVVEDDDGPVATAYYEPARATDRTWYLTMIAVRSHRQSQGRGAALLRHVEDDLRARGQRLLLVETSGLPAFVRTRAFYLSCGYEQAATVRDYYEDGEDMILFRRSLA